jgi:uncharacterized protein (TIGR04255 family)
MGRKMNNAPVYYVITQAKFNPILALDSYAPTIQDSLRRHGFPDAQKGVLNTFNLTLNAPIDGTQPPVPVSQVVRYTFMDVAKTSGFILDQGGLSFQTTEYDVFEVLSETFLKGLETVHKAVDLNYTDRIGLRYLDAVSPKSDEALPKYLHERVLGLYEKSGGQVVHSFSETVFKLGEINITSRTIIQNGALGFPPDLFQHSLIVPDRFQSIQGSHAIIDTDGFVERREAFNLGTIGTRLTAIHDEITKAFDVIATDHAREVWA